jgi:hypothetical protein
MTRLFVTSSFGGKGRLCFNRFRYSRDLVVTNTRSGHLQLRGRDAMPGARRQHRLLQDQTRCRTAAVSAAIPDIVSRSSNPLSATFSAVLPTSRQAPTPRRSPIAGGA